MDSKLIDLAIVFVRKQSDRNNGEVPEWNKFQELVKEHLKDPFNTKFKMPQEYYYAYLRGKGQSHAECLERMGLSTTKKGKSAAKKSFWKFW